MFKTLIAFIKMVLFMLKCGKERKLALKFDKEGNTAERDKIVFSLAPLWAKYCFKLCGATIDVQGLEKIPRDRAVVFIGNHQSIMDIPLLFASINKPMTFVAKAELGKIPLLSDWMRLLQCTFLERKSPRKSIQAIHDAAQGVKKGYSQVIFPEGHRSKGGPHLEFKAGSFKLAYMSESPIVPVTIDGTWRIYEGQNKMSVGEKVKLIIHDPIETAGLSREEQSAIPSRVEKIVMDSLLPSANPSDSPDSKKE